MLESKIGIADMAFYAPPQSLSLAELVQKRTHSQPGLGRHLERALRVTGQQSLRFPEAGEDTATMAAEASAALLGRMDEQGVDRGRIRYLAAGTETGLDHSKPLSAYVGGMLKQAGLPLPATLSNFQVQHACAGATLAAIGVGSLIGAHGRPGDLGLVLASDIARYQTESTAELTQGAGAAAILMARDPGLLELDLDSMGFASADVDDFFRPLGSTIAMVNGRYSMECYHEALGTAFVDHAARSGRTPSQILEESDLLVLHAPFANMPVEAMKRLLATQLGMGPEAADAYLAGKFFHQGLEPVARIGNTYTASVFIVLGWALEAMYRQLGPAMVGKRLLLGSYGSGNTMVVLSGTVAAKAPEIIAHWDLGRDLAAGHAARWSDYLDWTASSLASAPGSSPRRAKTKGFYLSGIREDGYRQYAWQASGANPGLIGAETVSEDRAAPAVLVAQA